MSRPKYKIGDRVKVLPIDSVLRSMFISRLANNIYTIREICNSDKHMYRMKELKTPSENDWGFWEEELELINGSVIPTEINLKGFNPRASME